MNEKLNQFLKRALYVNKIHFITALKTNKISLNYGSQSEHPVSIGYTEKYICLKKDLLDACRKISLKEWNNV